MAAPDERTATILLDMIDDKLTIPMKRQGFLDMYNGIDVIQTRDYIKISCKSFIEKICAKYLISWMHNFTSTDDRPTPLPTDPTWYKKFNAAIGDPDPKQQAKLAKKMGLTYRCGINMGHDHHTSRCRLCQCQVIASQLGPGRTPLPRREACFEILIQYSR